MKRKSFVCLIALIPTCLFFDHSRTVAAENSAPCVIGKNAAPIGFWTWPANTRVTVYLREPDFSGEDIDAVKIAIANWDASSSENGSEVRFSFGGLTRDERTAHGDLTIRRGDIYEKKSRHLALLEAHNLRNDRLIDYAFITVDPSVRKPEVLTNVIAHELGHSLGLLDCYECAHQSTAMGLLKTANDPNGIEGPTACDKSAVHSAYRELALRTDSTPNKDLAAQPSDHGEEPQADDTPITVRRP